MDTENWLAGWLTCHRREAPIAPFSVEAFVALGRYPYQGPLARLTRQDRLAVDSALELTDTAFLRARPMHALSGGERQRVMLAAALAQEARILLLDEPTVFLDPQHEAAFCALLARVHQERDLTMITVTHDLNRAVLMHDHLVALKDGRVAFSGTPSSFMDADHPATGLSEPVPSDLTPHNGASHGIAGGIGMRTMRPNSWLGVVGVLAVVTLLVTPFIGMQTITPGDAVLGRSIGAWIRRSSGTCVSREP